MRFVVDVFAVTSQFGDDRCPIVGSAGNNGSSRYSLGSVGSSFCSCGFCSSCFSGSRCVAGSFSGKREVYAGRRQAVFIVACTVFQIAYYFIVTSSQFDFLYECSLLFEIADFHFEDRVHFFDFLSARHQLSYYFGTFYLIDIECCRDRATFW